MTGIETWNLLVPRGSWRSGVPAQLKPGLQIFHYGPTVAIELQVEGKPQEWLQKCSQILLPHLGTSELPPWLLARPAAKRAHEVRISRLPSSSWLVVGLNNENSLPPGFHAEGYTRFDLTKKNAADYWVPAAGTPAVRQQKLHILKPKTALGA